MILEWRSRMTLANRVKKLLNKAKQLRNYAWSMCKKHKYTIGGPLLLISLVITIVLYIIGGWALVLAYLMCRLSGVCPL